MFSEQIHFASKTTQGIVAIVKSVVAPTHCAAYSGEVSNTSAKVIVEVADGRPSATVRNITQKSENPSILSKKQNMMGIKTRRIAIR